MSELLIQRIVRPDKLFQLLNTYKCEDNIIATDDEQFLTLMHDVRNISNIGGMEDYFHQHQNHFECNQMLEKKIRAAFLSGKKVIHKIFRSPTFITDLGDFLSEKENKELSTSTLWNVTLFYNQITQIMYKPAITKLFGDLTQNLTQLHENVTAFVDIYLKEEKIEFEQLFQIVGSFTHEELKEMNKEHHKVSLNGRLDIYKPDSGELIEIKASNMIKCPQSWIVQTLCYALMLNVFRYIQVKKIYIVNILQGKIVLNFSWPNFYHINYLKF